jgi:ADP-heptose:LPS heptosyltransferase
VAISLGTGDNPAKRIPGTFEEDLLRSLIDRRLSVTIDEGAGGEETERVRNLCAPVPGIQRFSGAFSDFANIIRHAKLYIGYDSAGQHVAAASAVPLVTVFAGFASERMFQRWKPWGAGPCEIIKVTDESSSSVLSNTLEAVDRILERAGANA